jgi:hypothetical protein
MACAIFGWRSGGGSHTRGSCSGAKPSLKPELKPTKILTPPALATSPIAAYVGAAGTLRTSGNQLDLAGVPRCRSPCPCPCGNPARRGFRCTSVGCEIGWSISRAQVGARAGLKRQRICPRLASNTPSEHTRGLGAGRPLRIARRKHRHPSHRWLPSTAPTPSRAGRRADNPETCDAIPPNPTLPSLS